MKKLNRLTVAELKQVCGAARRGPARARLRKIDRSWRGGAAREETRRRGGARRDLRGPAAACVAQELPQHGPGAAALVRARGGAGAAAAAVPGGGARERVQVREAEVPSGQARHREAAIQAARVHCSVRGACQQCVSVCVCVCVCVSVLRATCSGRTGIDKIRSAVAEAEDGKKMKARRRLRARVVLVRGGCHMRRRSQAKQREKMAPKLGRIDIDYEVRVAVARARLTGSARAPLQVLHDAFFRYQTKPPLTIHGDL